MEIDNNGVQRAIMRAAAVSIAGNIILTLIKGLAGWITGSAALIGDAVHSAADISSGVVVAFGVRISARKADRNYPYGYDRFECVAALMLAFGLFTTGILIGWGAIQELKSVRSAEIPGILAITAALVSIVVKESLFRYTWFCAQKYGSSALKADAWHHRSDVLCSIGVFVGVIGARWGWPALDSIAGLLICGLIVRAACRIFKDAIRRMMDHSCSIETEQALRLCAQEQPGVRSVEAVRTREFGSRIYAEMEIYVDADDSLSASDRISQRVHDTVEARFPQVKHISVCAKPAPEEKHTELC